MNKAGQAVFSQMESLLDKAAENGADGIHDHLMALAYGLGAQIGVMVKPGGMSDVMNAVVTEMTRGVQTGMEVCYGIRGKFDVSVLYLKKDRL
ncbi:hypothetical protein ACX1C1_21620 [Paenibacillus sp. strain BS8-2]